MKDIEVMKALYQSDGGAPKAFLCNSGCRRVTRTQRGMWAHLRIKHRIKKQAEFDFTATVVETKREVGQAA